MKIMSWNVRGLESLRATKRYKHMLKVYHPQIIFFMETKLNVAKMEKVHKRFGFHNDIDVSTYVIRGGLSLGWGIRVSTTLKSISKHQIDVEIQ